MEDKKVVKKHSYIVRADDEACTIKRINLLGDTIESAVI